MTYITTVLADSPLGYWQINDLIGTTTVTDYSGFSLDATWADGTRSAATWINGDRDGIFDGTDHVKSSLFSNFDLYNSDITFEIWVKYSPGSGTIQTAYFIRDDSGTNAGSLGGILLDNGLAGRVQLFDGASVIISIDAGLNDGAWHHIVGVMPVAASATHHLIIDRIDNSTVATRQSIASASRRMCIGGNWSPPFAGGSFQRFDGEIAQVAVYGSALSVASAQLHYDIAHSYTVLDSFNRVNNPSSMGNTDTGEAWVPDVGTWGVRTNAGEDVSTGTVTFTGSTIGAVAHVPFGSSDSLVQADIYPWNVDIRGGGVIARVSDASNFWYALLYRVGGDNAVSVFAGKASGGVGDHSIVSHYILPNQTGPWLLQLKSIGNNITVFVDGVNYGSVNNSFNNTATNAGLFIWDGFIGNNFENFAINPASENTLNYQIDAFLGTIIFHRIDTVLGMAASVKTYQIDANIGASAQLSSLDNVINFEIYSGTPSWHVIDPNTLYFSNSSITSNISPTTFQGGTHAGTEEVDRCGTNHIPNVKIISANQMSVNGGGTVALSDANLIGGGTGLNGDFRYSTLRIHLHTTRLTSLQNGKLYIYNTSVTDPGVDMDIAAYVVGNDMTTWQTINSYSTTGNSMANEEFQNDFIGGKINGVIGLLGRGPATDHYYNVVLSASPESTGTKVASLGVYFEYF